MWDVLSRVAEVAWDVLSGAAKMAWDVLSGVTNCCGMFCPGWQKMAWDVLSRDVLSYIRRTHKCPTAGFLATSGIGVRQLVFWLLVVSSIYFTNFHDFSMIIQGFFRIS